jgi:hypothetical protein
MVELRSDEEPKRRGEQVKKSLFLHHAPCPPKTLAAQTVEAHAFGIDRNGTVGGGCIAPWARDVPGFLKAKV